MGLLRRACASVAIAAAGFTGSAALATPAPAQPVTQEGLVNVNVSNVGVQIPIALAANICDVNVAVLVADLRDGPADCEADAGSEANIDFAPGSGPTNQTGLINVNLSNVAVQVPIGVAANVCDVNVAVLVNEFIDTGSDCNADADSAAFITSIR